MSKSLGNAPDPAKLIAKFGADALRFWMYVINQPGDAKNFDEATVADAANKFFNPLLNVVKFYELYGEKKTDAKPGQNVLDRWILARLNQLIAAMSGWLDDYKITEPARALRDFVSDLSQWYLRRSRERFKSADEIVREEVNVTLGFVLRELAKLLAPFTPFVAEEIYQRQRGEKEPESVHLCGWPSAGSVDDKLLMMMTEVRRLVSISLEEREKAGVKVRQPLKSVKLKTKSEKLNPELAGLIRDELNVKEVIFDSALTKEVELDTSLTPALEEEGELRELVRSLQDWRKKQGLRPGDPVVIPVPKAQAGLVRRFETELKRAVGASGFVFE